MTRALLVAPSSAPGGSQRVLTAVARHLPAHGVDVTAVLLQRGVLEEWLIEAGCTTEVIDAGRTRQLRRTGPTLHTLARRAAATDIVVSSESKGHVYGGLAASWARMPEVWWQHGIPAATTIERVAARVPTRGIVCYTTEAAKAQGCLAPASPVEVIPGGIDVGVVAARRGSGAGIRARLGLGERPVIGIVGRLQQWKGQDVFLRSAAIVRERVPTAQFVVVGEPTWPSDGPYARSLVRLADELGIAEYVHFAGHQADPYPWFDAFDVVVHASDAEPFGLVVLEGMALGKPVVATAAGGPATIIEHGRSGMLVPVGDPERMARTITDVLTHPSLATRLSNGARRRADDFSEQRMAERLAGLIERIAPRAPRIGDRASINAAAEEQAVPGLHRHLAATVVPTVAPAGARTVDLGAGSGAFAARLAGAGFDVLACDIDPNSFRARVPFRRIDLDDPDFAGALGSCSFDLVTAVEVIEHLESPTGFLRNIARLLSGRGVAVVTTPNVESLAGRLKFAATGGLRSFDEQCNPVHVSPIFHDLFLRHYVGRAGLVVARHATFPPRGHALGRPAYTWVFNLLGPLVWRRPLFVGDSHVFVLRRREP